MTTTPNTPAEKSAVKPFIISRTFDAPRELVWKAWAERDRFVQWFGPKGCVISHAKMDFRPGGTLLYAMKMNGHEMWGKFLYREIVAPERMVVVSSFSDAGGGLARHPYVPAWPMEMLSTTTLEDENGKTKITIRWEPLNPTAEELKTFNSMHDGMCQGWGGTFEQLAAYLAKS